MTHTFQFDPNAILGVPMGASLSEIRDAYHKKSLKHHPDKGGDEWAFRIVVRSYEILTTARVVNRASDEYAPRPSAAASASGFRAGASASATSTPPPRASWFRPGASARAASSAPDPRAEADAGASRFASAFRPGASSASASNPSADPTPRPGAPNARDATNLSGWGGANAHEGKTAAELARVVEVELLILRFELECSFDLFARNPEDRNLSCTVHVTWPPESLMADSVESAGPFPDAAKIIKALNDALKVKAVRKHALTRRSQVEGDRFVGWLTYPTAVMASEAVDALRDALKPYNLTLEKQVREMALPRQW